LRPDMSEDERLGLTQKYEEVSKSLQLYLFSVSCQREIWLFERERDFRIQL